MRDRSYTAREMESHFVRCGHRLSAGESRKALLKVRGKYERNPMIRPAEMERRLGHVEKRRDWETRKLFPEEGQCLMDGYLGRRRK